VRADELARQVIGAAIEVHRHLGPGFLESVYEEALAVELRLREVSFVQQYPVGVLYKGCKVGDARPDFYVDDELVVEVKAVERLAPVHTAQVISYLKSVDRRLGLLINFKVALLKHGIQRVVLSRHNQPKLGDLGVFHEEAVSVNQFVGITSRKPPARFARLKQTDPPMIRWVTRSQPIRRQASIRTLVQPRGLGARWGPSSRAAAILATGSCQ
jgi:GxxExxY protein